MLYVSSGRYHLMTYRAADRTWKHWRQRQPSQLNLRKMHQEVHIIQLSFYLDWIPSTSKPFWISEMWNFWIHSMEASIFSIICIQDHSVIPRHINSYAIVSEALSWVEVEDKQKLCSFKSHNFISLMLPAYIPLKKFDLITDYKNTHSANSRFVTHLVATY